MRISTVNVIAALSAAVLAASGVAYASAKSERAPVAAATQTDSMTTKADLSRIDGPATAKVWVVEISDMQCPFCQKWHEQTYPKLRDEFIKTGKIRFAYVNFPLGQHKNAFSASRAAMCAGTQGKFWAMHDAIFNTQATWENLPSPDTHFESLAAKSGVEITGWKSCVEKKIVDDLIEADVDRARSAGVQSTPSFLVAGKLMEGAVPIEDLRKAINDALSTK